MNFASQFLFMMYDNENNDKVKSIIDNCRLQRFVEAHFCDTGPTLLHYAAHSNNHEIAKYLLDKGCQVDAQDGDGFTALMIAASMNNAQILQLLLSAGADVSRKSYDQKDALSLALDIDRFDERIFLSLFDALKLKYRSEAIARRLITLHCGLDVAVYTRDAKVIEYMIERGVPVEGPDPAYETPLHVAVTLSDAEMVRVLLKYGADIDALDHDDATPVSCLDYGDDDSERDGDRLEILKMFLSRGASLTTCHRNGSFQIAPTLVGANCQAVGLVLQSDIDLTVENPSGKTPLHFLAMNKNFGIVNELKRYVGKIDVNAQDSYGNKPLISAVYEGNVDMVEFLVDRGADVDARALYQAYDTHTDVWADGLDKLRARCAEILLQRGADPEVIFSEARMKDIVDDVGFDMVKLAVAALAIRERQGVAIAGRTFCVIKLYRTLDIYLDKCRRLLGEKICESVSVFDLLVADEKRMARYLNNDKLAVKLTRMGRKLKLKSVYWYYYSTMKKKFVSGTIEKMLRDNVAEIISEISGLGPRDIPIEIVIGYLDSEDLWRLN